VTDAIVARLRTLVPVAWGSLIAWLLTAAPWVGDVLNFLHIDPTSLAAQSWVTLVSIAGFYELVRRVQPWLNVNAPWLAKILAGSTLMPSYSEPVLANGLTLTEVNADLAATGADTAPKHVAD